MTVFFILLSFLLLSVAIYSLARKKKPLPQPAASIQEMILSKHVVFYNNLNNVDKGNFVLRIRLFLDKVKITGVQTSVEDLDSVLIAAAAIIPIFYFKNWEYINVHEVLLYPHSFSSDFDLEGDNKNTIGEVGNGPLQNIMILSKPDLRNGFLQAATKSNTAIHEFVHLVDKTDGAADGMPQVLMERQYAIPWLKRIHAEMKQIQKGSSDINPYALTNEAEFFAVTSEYFFSQPHLMQSKHPELYSMLEKIFVREDQ